jgi:hypothetical protein
MVLLSVLASCVPLCTNTQPQALPGTSRGVFDPPNVVTAVFANERGTSEILSVAPLIMLPKLAQIYLLSSRPSLSIIHFC